MIYFFIFVDEIALFILYKIYKYTISSKSLKREAGRGEVKTRLWEQKG